MVKDEDEDMQDDDFTRAYYKWTPEREQTLIEAVKKHEEQWSDIQKDIGL